MIVLGIETSCDETAAAIVTDGREILADLVLSQPAEHAPYGGVVPEIAARSHVEHLDGLVRRALEDAALPFAALDGVAATAGPGLIGAVMVGLMTGKAIAAVHDKPLIAVNHLEGHALSARLVEPALEFPYLLLLVSGGHCQLLIVDGVGRYRRLGTTIDDAVGEAFDKAAKLLDLGYPGGPAIERAAEGGDPARFALPRPLRGREGCDFSFSGLKTALLHLVEAARPLSAQDRADFAASFQAAVRDVLIDRTDHAMTAFAASHGRTDTELDAHALVVAGGVAANGVVRDGLGALAAARGFRIVIPPARLCTDNAVMIAWAGVERLRQGMSDPLDVSPRARWPLDPGAGLARGAGEPGRLGRKA